MNADEDADADVGELARLGAPVPMVVAGEARVEIGDAEPEPEPDERRRCVPSWPRKWSHSSSE